MRLALRCALIGIGSAALSPLALASSFYSSTTTTPGSTATFYAGYTPTLPLNPPDGAVTSTYNISPNEVWADPVGPSSWVSFNPNTAPGGSYVAPNGYYDYKVDLTQVPYGEIALTVLADDTVSVFLNDVELLQSQAPGPYPKCAATQPNCINAYTFDFASGSGAYLDFEVHQAAGYSTGLDFYGTTVTPEPGSLVLLGSGLIGGAGNLFRRHRRSSR